MSIHSFLTPTKTAFGKQALAHLPFELFSLGAATPLVLVQESQLDEKIHIPLVKAFKDSGMPLAFAGVDPHDPDALKQVYTWSTQKGCDALLVLGEGQLVNLAKKLRLCLALGPEILPREPDQPMALPQGVDLFPLVYLPTGPGMGWETSHHLDMGGHRRELSGLAPDLACITPELTRPPKELAPRLNAGFTALAVCAEVHALGGNPLAKPYAAAGLSWTLDHFKPLVAHHFSPGKGRKDKTGETTTAGIAHATAIAGFLLSNFPNLTCLKALPQSMDRDKDRLGAITPGHAMALSLVEGLCERKVPGDLLLPLAGPERFAATPPFQRGERALTCLKDLFNDLFALSNGTVPRGPADLDLQTANTPKELPHDLS